MIVAVIPKHRPKSILIADNRWSALSLDSTALPSEVTHGRLYDATVRIFGSSTLRTNSPVAVGRMESFDTTISYYIAVWVPTAFLGDDLRLEIDILGDAGPLDIRNFMRSAPP